MIGRVKVYRFRLYDIASDDFKVSARMATGAFIKRVGGELVRSTELEIDKKHVNADGMTQFFCRDEELVNHVTADGTRAQHYLNPPCAVCLPSRRAGQIADPQDQFGQKLGTSLLLEK